MVVYYRLGEAMDFENFQTEYGARFKGLTADEKAAWPRKLRPLQGEDVIQALDVLDARKLAAEADGRRAYCPKIGAILAESARARIARMRSYEEREPVEVCAKCDGSGYLSYYGGRVGDLYHGRLRVGDYRAGRVYSGVVPCLCSLGERKMQDLRQRRDMNPLDLQALHAARQKVDAWRREAMPALMAELGVSNEVNLGLAMYRAWQRHIRGQGDKDSEKAGIAEEFKRWVDEAQGPEAEPLALEYPDDDIPF